MGKIVCLLPRQWHVLKELEDSVGHIFKGTKIDSLIMTELLRSHVTMIFHYLAYVFCRHILFRSLYVSMLLLVSIAPRVEVLPLTCCAS